MPAKPMLDNVELQIVQKVEAEDEEVLAQHSVPALEGDFLQDLGRRVTRLTLVGVMVGTEAGEQLKTLRLKFRKAEPVSFVSDIATATTVDKVLIEEFAVRELAGKPERFEYEFTLREFLPPPPSEKEEPPPPPPEPPPPPPPVVETGTLIVEVTVEGDSNFDFSTVTVTVDGTKDDGTTLSQTLTNRAENVWTEENMVLGQFTAHAVVNGPSGMSGTAPAQVRAGQTTRAQINLRPGAIIATAFVVHFRFDNAFIEPCMREVLQQVAQRAAAPANVDEKLLIVGHTDKTGSDQYNQSLSERRARSVFAYLTFNGNQATSEAEWNELRQRGTGNRRLKDNWGTRQYQYMLQSLHFYPGSVDGDHGPLTDDAVRTFRAAKGLPPGTTVDDDVWAALIHDYLAETPLNVANTKFLPNAKDACNSGILKWLGCGEEDPLPLPQPTTANPHRPYRRVEMLFVRAATLPCEVPQPDTFDLPPPGGAVNATWCLGPGGASRHCCFATRNCPAPNPGQWCITPAETGSFVVSGRILFEDGTPAANMEYVLIAPDGEFMDGEAVSGARRGDGNFGRTQANGTFTYPGKPKGPGTYTMEIRPRQVPPESFIARLEGEPQSAAKGNVVCKRLDGSAPFNVVVRSLSTVVNPVITAPEVIVVKKPHTNPARQAVTLTTDGPFFRAGTVTRTGTAITFFDALVGGNEIQFDGTDNVFSGAQLSAGVQIFAASTTRSVALGDVQLTLTLTPGATPIGPPATTSMTAIELTLDICQTRTVAGVDPPVLSAADKINPGRTVQAANSRNSHERALVIVSAPNPPVFTGSLVLNPIDARVRLFAEADETPSGQAPLITPLTVAATGGKFFVEGVTVSNAPHDTGFQLGILGGEADGDRVAITVIQLDVIATAAVAAPAATFVRFGLWDDAFDPATGALRNLAAENRNFIGSDSRGFFFRLRDPNRAGTATVKWRTVLANDANDDTNETVPPTAVATREDLTLTETAAGSGVFISKRVFVVTDNVDRAQAVDSGLAAGDVGLRGLGQSNHRLRRMRNDNTHQLDGKVVVEYAPINPGVGPFRLPTTLFNRAPEERRRLKIHFVNVRDRVGGTPSLTGARRLQVTQAFQEMYALCGVFTEIDEIVIDPRPSTIGWPARFPGDPLAVDPAVEGFSFPGANLVASASQTDLINFVRGLAVFNASDLYIIYVGRILDSPLTTPLTSGTLGQAFPDSFVAAASPARGFVFVGVRGATINTDLHEVTHSTTDLRNAAGGHFYYGVIGPAGPGQFTVGNVDAKNLMFPIALSGLGTSDPKRLWDTANPDNPMVNNNVAPPMVIPSQIQAITGSRFTRNF
jgi:outer membrane protein OmpA-like peptidoglycan-associated protein